MKYFREALMTTEAFLEGLFRNRKIGTSSLLKKIASVEDVIIIVATQEQKNEQFSNVDKEKVMTIDEFSRRQGTPPKIILIDNYTMIRIAEAMRANIIKASREINERNQMLQTIKVSIEKWEQSHELDVDISFMGQEMASEKMKMDQMRYQNNFKNPFSNGK